MLQGANLLNMRLSTGSGILILFQVGSSQFWTKFLHMSWALIAYSWLSHLRKILGV